MQYLLDTGVLLRLVIRSDPLHAQIRQAVRILKDQGHQTATLPQNIAEFWNVCTRPPTARGGMGLSIENSHHRLKLIERAISIVADKPEVYVEWKRLLLAYRVVGVQVHDARIAAAMAVHGIRHLMTLNSADFARYSHITAVLPADVVAAGVRRTP